MQKFKAPHTGLSLCLQEILYLSFYLQVMKRNIRHIFIPRDRKYVDKPQTLIGILHDIDELFFAGDLRGILYAKAPCRKLKIDT